MCPGEKRHLDNFPRTRKTLNSDISLSAVGMLKRRRNMYHTDVAANNSRRKQEKETAEKKVLHVLTLMFDI